MIVPMKSVTLLAIAEEENVALESLRDLGVMQIVPGKCESEGSARAREAAEAASRTLHQLEAYAEEDVPVPDAAFSPAEFLAEAAEKLARLADLQNERAAAARRREQLATWGRIPFALLQELSAAGLRFWICTALQPEYEKIAAREGVCCIPVFTEKGRCGFLAVAENAEFSGADLPVFPLTAEDDSETLREHEENLSRQTAALEKDLKRLGAFLPRLRKEADRLGEQLEFARAVDAVSGHGEIISLQGYVPEPAVGSLREAARKNGWGLSLRDPGEDEDVPVLIRENRFTAFIKPLFDFLGVIPGYREMDVSGGVLVFFTIFYAIIIGDAGYGTLFLLLTLLARFLLRGKPAARAPLRMFLLLSIATIVWGTLCGNWFGVSLLPGLPCLTAPGRAQQNLQAFCFMLAVAQLSTGRIWKALHDHTLHSIGENAGWMLIIWGNFLLTLKLIVWPGAFPVAMYYLYGAGLLLVVCFGVRWNRISDVFQFPFSIIGSFTDVLSYIRLFAVGMAGSCIAGSFNGMGMDICKASPWFILFGVLAILAGHLLNVALAFMSVLVHGVRLNTLEFSNHTGLSWSGRKFTPFKRHQPKSEEKI